MYCRSEQGDIRVVNLLYPSFSHASRDLTQVHDLFRGVTIVPMLIFFLFLFYFLLMPGLGSPCMDCTTSSTSNRAWISQNQDLSFVST